jgi:hypothetical protein
MNDPEPGDDTLASRDAADRLSGAAEDANALLYFAATSGRDVPVAIRDPIVKTRTAAAAGTVVSRTEEGEFLDAYARLAAIVRPVTAATLRATSRNRRWIWPLRSVWQAPLSEAQLVAYRFGLFALLLVMLIGAGEWTRTFLDATVVNQAEHAKVWDELQAGKLTLRRLTEEIAALDSDASRTMSSQAVRTRLMRQRDDFEVRLKTLDQREDDLAHRITAGYKTLDRLVPFVHWNELRNVIVPVGLIIGGYLLPVLYGALGTCAFILRTTYAQMVDRSFDPRRTGEFIVRVFLGTLSGITLQWVVVRDGHAVPGGITPAVLAFLGGYSVELLFTAMDRLLAVVSGALRGVTASTSGRAAAARAPGPVVAHGGHGRPGDGG